MKTISLTIIAMALAAGLAAAETVNFDNMQTGAPPAGWTATQTGSGTAKWAVEKDDSAPRNNQVRQRSRSVSKTTRTLRMDSSKSDSSRFPARKIRPAA